MIANDMVEYIAERIAGIVRKHPESHLSIYVFMPQTATQCLPSFAVDANPILATDGEPVTLVYVR